MTAHACLEVVYMASRDKVDVAAFQRGIEYALENLGKSKFGFKRTTVSNFKSKRHVGSANEIASSSSSSRRRQRRRRELI